MNQAASLCSRCRPQPLFFFSITPCSLASSNRERNRKIRHKRIKKKHRELNTFLELHTQKLPLFSLLSSLSSFSKEMIIETSARPGKGRAHAAHVGRGPVAERGQVAAAVELGRAAAGVDSGVGRLFQFSSFCFRKRGGGREAKGEK